jgi:hypothetical protein
VDGMEAGAEYPAEALTRARQALREKDATKDIAKFSRELKVHLDKLAMRLNEKAYDFHRVPPEEENTFNDLRNELRGVYDDLRNVQRLLDIAAKVLKTRYDLQRIRTLNAELGSFLDDSYGDADLHLSAAARVAAQYADTEAQGSVDSDTALALARSARDAANAYLRFAEEFEATVRIVGDLANRVGLAQTKIQ